MRHNDSRPLISTPSGRENIMKKPKPLSEGQLKAYPHRPPLVEGGPWAWRVVYHEDGKQRSVKGVGGRHTRAAMKQRLRQLNAQGGWKETPVEKPARRQDMRLLMAKWLMYQRKRAELGRITDSTVELYTRLRKHLRPLDTHLLTGFRLATLQDWVDGMDAAGAAPRTIKGRWGVLVAAWSWGRARGYCAPVDLPPVELPTIQGYLNDHHTPTAKDVEQVRAQLADWAGVYLDALRFTGARTGEVAALQWADLQMSPDNVLRIDGKQATPQLRLSGKTGARWVPLPDALRDRLLEWQAGREGRPVWPVWPVSDPKHSFEQRLVKACQAAKIRRFTPHGLRRLASTHLIGAGVDPKAYSAQMGHRYEEGLRTYAGVLGENLQAAAQVLGNLHGATDSTKKENQG